MGVVIKPILKYERRGNTIVVKFDRTINSLLKRAVLMEARK